MRKRTIAVLVLAGLLLLPLLAYLSGAVFYVNEMENAVITRFGDVQYAVITGFNPQKKKRDEQVKKLKKAYPGKIITGAGLQFKTPFVEQAHYFDSRLLHWDGEVKNVSTMDLRTLHIDTAGFWRILDVIKFYERLSNRRQAVNRISGVINSQIEDVLSRTRLIEAVRNENLELEERVKKRLQQAGEEKEDQPESAKIRYGRKKLIKKIQDELKEKLMKRFGIKLADVMFTQLNYTQSVRQNVYDRMISERKRIAARYRARGQRKKREILGEVTRQKRKILSEADRKVKNILGEAEGKQIKIHADAFRKQPTFYRFHRSLEMYRESLGENATFLLSNDNRLLKFTTDDQLTSLSGDTPEEGGQNGSPSSKNEKKKKKKKKE